MLLIWVILAVGVIGDSGDPQDLMYVAVLPVGLVGAVIARLQPRGMARTLVAMALTQASVAAVALVAGMVPDYNSAYGDPGREWDVRHAVPCGGLVVSGCLAAAVPTSRAARGPS